MSDLRLVEIIKFIEPEIDSVLIDLEIISQVSEVIISIDELDFDYRAGVETGELMAIAKP